jgi:hypothetical protein
MRKFASIAIVLVSVGIVWPGEGNDGRAIVEKAIKAAGGEANLAKHNSVTTKQKGTYYGMGDGLPYTAVSMEQWPDKTRMEVEGVFTVVFNGDKGWTHSNGETTEMGKDEVALQLHNHRANWISTLLPLKERAFQLKTMGEAKVGDQAARIVQVTRKDYPEVKLFFAKDTGLLVKTEYRTKAAEQEFKEVTQTVNYSDYRDVDGAKVPFKIAIKRDGKIYVEAEVTELKTGKLDAKLFGKPSAD